MKRPRMTLTYVVLLGVGLAACDAWPTSAVNKSSARIEFRWHHQDYADWSHWVLIPIGQSNTLARAQYVEDFTGIEVRDDNRIYAVTPEQMLSFRRTCRRSMLDHMDTLGDCEITYAGGGRFTVRRVQ